MDADSKIGASLGPGRNNFCAVTEEVLESMIVIYSVIFRTRNAQESLRDAGPETFGNDSSLLAAFQAAWQAHFTFCESMPKTINVSTTHLTMLTISQTIF